MSESIAAEVAAQAQADADSAIGLTAEERASEPMLRYFVYAHLPADLGAVSSNFCFLAENIVATLPRTPERTVALRKLLEAKDAAVRAALDLRTP